MNQPRSVPVHPPEAHGTPAASGRPDPATGSSSAAPDPTEPGPIFAADPLEDAHAATARESPRDTSPLEYGTREGGWPGLPGVLAGGLRAVVLMPVRPGAIPVSAAWCMLLIAATLGVAIGADAWILGSDTAEFNWQSLRAVGLDLMIVVLGGAWLAEPRRAARAEAGPDDRRAARVARSALQSVIAPPSEDAPAPRTLEPTIAESGPDTTIRLASPVAVPIRAAAVAPAGRPPAGEGPGGTLPATPPATAPDAVPALHFATVVFAGSFWLLLVAYGASIWLNARADAGLPSVVPGMWFYNLTTVWPWLIALRATIAMHRHHPLPGWRRAFVLLAMLASTAWTLFDPGDPYWVAPYEYEADDPTMPADPSSPAEQAIPADETRT
ncbi:MAG: hypothetical protein AB7P21_13005 [Lautropia sp.]